MERVRLGVVGCGVIGQFHLKAAKASSQVDLVALADLREDVARKSAEEFQVRKVYPDGEALIADPAVEAVVLAMPANVRTALTLSAFRQGKHVLTEKPVAMNAGEVTRMIQAKGDRVGACCSARYRFLESAQAATDFIATGALGPLRVVRFRAWRAAAEAPQTMPPAWRLIKALNGGGILANWGCYDLDYMLGITGWSLKPRTVLAGAWTIPPRFESHAAPRSDAETHAIGLVQCEGGTVLSLERGEYMTIAGEQAWQIIGENGALRLQMTYGKDKKIYHDDTSVEKGVVTRTLWEGDEQMEGMSVRLLDDFATAIREGRPPTTGLEQALIVQQITDAVYASSEQGRAVEIRS